MKKLLIVILFVSILLIVACGETTVTPLKERSVTIKPKTVNIADVEKRIEQIKTDFNVTYCDNQITLVNRQMADTKELIEGAKNAISDFNTDLLDAQNQSDEQEIERLKGKISMQKEVKAEAEKELLALEEKLKTVSDKCVKLIEDKDKTICLEFKAGAKEIIAKNENDIIKSDRNINQSKAMLLTLSATSFDAQDLSKIITRETKKKAEAEKAIEEANLM